MVIDLRQMAFATLWKQYEKKINNEKTKECIRNGEATYKFADYCNISLKDYSTSRYSEEDQRKIDKFIEENHIEKIKETKENYSTVFTPSEKAIKEFNKMLDELENSQYKNISKVASKIKASKIKATKK